MSNYYTLKIKNVVQETKDTITIHFKQPIFKKVKYKSGQFLTLIMMINGKKERRSYSMSSAPNLDDTLAITVKRVAGGLVSNYLNDHAKEGDSIEVMEPMGNFTLEPNKDLARHIVLFGAGSGITPLMSILKSTLFFEPKSIVSLLYGNRHEGSIIFRKQLDELKQKFGDRLNIVHSLTEPDSLWGGYKGRIDNVSALNFLNLVPKMPVTEYFMCGPLGMMDEVKQALQKLKVPANQIHFESFTPAAPTAEKIASTKNLQDHIVTIVMNGVETKINVPANKTILEAALDEGLDLPFSCQSGLCTACMCKKISGEMIMTDGEGLSQSEIDKGFVLVCVGHPTSDNLVLEV
jgi:ring-1,2-phenylacetyl-CoA epoxidase subunit PaaE